MESLVHYVLIAHSFVRWLALTVAVAAILKYAWGWLRGGTFNSADRALKIAFPIFIDLQALLGIIYFFWTGFTSDGFPRFRFEHGTAMFLALVCAHLPLFWKQIEDRTRFRNSAFAVLASVALVLVGISRLPGGLSR